MSRFAPWSLRELVNHLASERSDSAAALARAQARIATTEPDLNAWVEVGTPAPAADSGLLSGVPVGVKDIIDLAGFATKCGSALRANDPVAVHDATIVSQWRRAGAIPLGKTVTTEFAFFAPGPTRNPVHLGHTPGGSSSGSAAAVASGQVPLALGSQTAGSVTRPAAYCGVASLVMSHGRFPVTGVTGLSPSLDSHGVLAATVSDLALAWAALSGDPDPASQDADTSPRIMVWYAEPLGVVQPAMRAALDQAAAKIARTGASLIAFPEEQRVASLIEAHRTVMAYEAARERAYELARSDELSAPLADLLRTGAAISTADYESARAEIAATRMVLDQLFRGCDAVLGPAAPGAAPAGLDNTGDPVLSRPWQALGLPCVGIPGQRDQSGLPLGLQLVGPAHSAGGAEHDLLSLGCRIERILKS